MDFNLLFRWFVGLTADDQGLYPTVLSKNRTGFLLSPAQPTIWYTCGT
jgi:hypothetical protein